jgi:hypothetical protein
MYDKGRKSNLKHKASDGGSVETRLMSKDDKIEIKINSINQ